MHKIQCVSQKLRFDILVNIADRGLGFSALGVFPLMEHIQAWICIHLHQPGLHVLINKNVKAEHLKAAGIVVSRRRNEAMIRIFEVGLQRDNGLLGQFFNLFSELLRLFSFETLQLLKKIGQELLRRSRVDVCKVLASIFELVRLFVETVVREVHMHVFHVEVAGLLVIRLQTVTQLGI